MVQLGNLGMGQGDPRGREGLRSNNHMGINCLFQCIGYAFMAGRSYDWGLESENWQLVSGRSGC